MKNHLSGEDVQYRYDSLRTADDCPDPLPGVGQSFTYDGFGNLVGKGVTKGSATVMNVTADPATNRLQVGGMAYDANGNITQMPNTGSMVYDGRNRMVSLNAVPVAYDPDNRRVFHVEAGPVVDFWLPNGEKLMTLGVVDDPYQGAGALQFAPNRKYFWFGGRMVGSKASGNYQEWMQPDRLGSHARVYPYGEEITATTTSYKFATYQRGGGGLDYAMNRHYSPVYGRFTSADPYRASAGPGDPGSWNRYAYVQGDPVNFNDPAGLARCVVVGWISDGSGTRANVQCVSELGRKSSFDNWIPVGAGVMDLNRQRAIAAEAENTIGADLDRQEIWEVANEIPEFASAIAGTVRVTGTLIQRIIDRYGTIIGVGIANLLARVRGRTDPVTWDIWQTTDRDDSGRCKKPTPLYKWRDAGNEHGSTSGYHWHWMDPHLVDALLCRWWIGRASGATDPGPEWIERPGTYQP